MANQQSYSGDQPRFNSKELTRREKPANLERSVSPVRSFGDKKLRRMDRGGNSRATVR